jgi:uncharacterized membrane protein
VGDIFNIVLIVVATIVVFFLGVKKKEEKKKEDLEAEDRLARKIAAEMKKK